MTLNMSVGRKLPRNKPRVSYATSSLRRTYTNLLSIEVKASVAALSWDDAVPHWLSLDPHPVETSDWLAPH